MRLKSVKLCNFRQFYGATPEIQLSGEAKNITMIHGNNGAGKTTLLNAFTWVLYEQFTAAFAHAEYLVNKRAIQEAIPGKSIEYFVDLNFEHEYKSYQLKRRCYATKKTDQEIVEEGESQLFMLVAGDDGCWRPPLEHPEEIIGRILPASLHQYFFFDGERIDHIIRYQKKTGLTEATKELLGIKIFERSAEHLKNARRSLEEELRKIGNIQTQTLIQNKQDIEQEIDRIRDHQDRVEENIEQAQNRKQQLGEELLALKGAEDLQILKSNLEREIKLTREQLVRFHQEIKQTISSQGYTVFMMSLVEKCSDLFASLDETEALPRGIKKPFVQNLINQQRCICGTELIAGTSPHEQVTSWMEKAENGDVEEGLMRLQSQTQEIEKQALKFWEIIDDRQEQVTQFRETLTTLEHQLETVKQQLREYPDEKINALQEALDSSEKELESLLIEKGRNEIELQQKSEQLDLLNQQLNQEESKEAKQQLVQRRREATEAAIACIQQLKSDIEQRFRITLEQKVQEIFADISFTPYVPKLDSNYELSLVETTTGEEQVVAASTGENQILSLSLIGGIMDRVRNWSANNTLIAPDSSTFPMVMDSPFGSLDEIYRRQVAKALPKLANQLVVLVTKTQWRGEVAEEMNQFIGKQYVLVYFSPKRDCSEDGLTINGRYYPLVQPSENGFEYTEIREII